MASMKDSDTGLWLHNKLGSTDELWTPPSIASLLTVSVIDNIRLCFSSLSPPVKLKLLLGMLHLPRRTVDEVGSRRWLAFSPPVCYQVSRLLKVVSPHSCCKKKASLSLKVFQCELKPPAAAAAAARSSSS